MGNEQLQKEQETVDGSEDVSSKNPFYRAVKTYVLRAGRMTAAQERDYAELSNVWCIPYENKKLNFLDIFGNTNPVVLRLVLEWELQLQLSRSRILMLII